MICIQREMDRLVGRVRLIERSRQREGNGD